MSGTNTLQAYIEHQFCFVCPTTLKSFTYITLRVVMYIYIQYRTLRNPIYSIKCLLNFTVRMDECITKMRQKARKERDFPTFRDVSQVRCDSVYCGGLLCRVESTTGTILLNLVLPNLPKRHQGALHSPNPLV